MQLPVGQAERALPPTPADHRGLRAIPGGKTSPWCRPALRATKSGRFRFATTEVADPSPVLASAGIRKSAGINPGAANWFRTTMAQRKPAGCDLLHKGANRLALNLQDGPEDLPTLARHESGHPHRLGLDRDRRWSGACRAALSHSDLTERGSGDLSPAFKIGCAHAGTRFSPPAKFCPGRFEWARSCPASLSKTVKRQCNNPMGIPNTHCVNRA